MKELTNTTPPRAYRVGLSAKDAQVLRDYVASFQSTHPYPESDEDRAVLAIADRLDPLTSTPTDHV